MDLNLKGNTPIEIFGVSEERAIIISTTITDLVKKGEEIEFSTLINAAKEVAQTENELGLAIMAIGRVLGVVEMLSKMV